MNAISDIVLSRDKALDLIAANLEEDGYTVYRTPSESLIPDFFGSYRPDAIALGKGKKMAIHLLVRNSNSTSGTDKLLKISPIFAGQDEWTLKVITLNLGLPDHPVGKADGLVLIKKNLAEVETLLKQGHMSAALMLGWSLLEAIARLLLDEDNPSFKSSYSLKNGLAQEGYVTADDADILREIFNLRNLAAHGDLSIEIPQDKLAFLIATIKSLIAFQEAA